MLAVYAVAAGILFLAMIAISNMLFMSVLQRTPEFGIMKSLGASNADVMSLMLFEGMLCGLLGSLVAIPIGFAIAMGGKQLFEEKRSIRF